MSLGAGLPHAAAIHGETHTPANTLLTNVASFQYTWLLRSTGQLFGDSRTVYTDTAYETVALLSAVDVATNLETADIQPADSYVFIKHIRNLGNGYDTYQVRGESTANFVRGMYLDADGDSVYDASDPPVSTVVLRELAETVVLVLVQAPAAAADGSADTLLLSATSTAVSLPSAETVTLALTVADTGLGIALVAPASGHETSQATVRFAWSSQEAETYTWQLSKNASFTSLVDSIVDTKSTSILRDVPHEDTFYWRVIGRDTNTYETTSGRILILDTSVRQVSALLPADGHETSQFRPVVSWLAPADSVGIDSFVVEVSTSSAFTGLVFADTVGGSRTADTVSGLYNDTYSWRIRAIDRLGNTGAPSAVRVLRIDTNVSFGAVRLIQPNGPAAASYRARAMDSIVVEVNDTDPNANAGAIETTAVTITNVTLGTEIETVVLSEQSANSSTFQGTVAVSISASNIGNDGKLYVRPGDSIKVTYIDIPRYIAVTASATMTGGGLAGDSVAVFSGNHPVVAAGQLAPFSIAVYDAAGDTVSNETVTFAIDYNGSGAAGGASVTAGTTTITPADGILACTLTLGAGNGVYIVKASASTGGGNGTLVAYTDRRDVPANKWTLIAPFKHPDTRLAGLSQLSYSGTATSYWYDPAIASANGTFDRYKSVAGQSAPNNSANGEFDSYAAGRGYWFKSTVATGVGLADSPIPNPDTFLLPLATGANMIGNPFTHFIDWLDDVAVDTDPSGTAPVVLLRGLNSASVIDTRLQWRDQSAEQYINPMGSGDTAAQLKPWVGMWVKVNQACTLVFYPNPRLPQTANSKRQAALYKNMERDMTNWRLRLMAYGSKSEIRDEFSFIGVAPAAADGEDVNDLWKAPGLYGDLQVFVGDASGMQQDPAAPGGAPTAHYYGASIAAPVKTATFWPLSVRGPAGAVTLKWDAGALPPEYRAFLVGGPDGAVDMTQTSSAVLQITDDRSPVTLMVAVGYADYLSALLAPNFSKDRTFVFPNPGPDAAGNMIFKYNLQSAGEVTLKIYDVGGRLVKELKEAGAPGTNSTLKWDTTDRHGQRVGSGVYIYILEIGGAKFVDKLAIVR